MTAVLDAPVDQAVQQLPPALLHPNPFNPRKKLGDLSDLTTTIPDVGILQPLTAVTAEAWNASVDNDDLRVDGGFVLVIGHRRHAAAQKLKLDTVPVLVDDTKIGEAMGGGRVAMLIENLSRVDLDPVDEGESFVQLLELLGCSQRDLAKRLNVDQSYISRAVQLTKIPAKAQEAVRKGRLDKTAAVELAKLADDAEAIAAATKAVLGNQSGYGTDVAKIERAARAVEDKRALDAKVAELAANGFTVIDATKEFGGYEGARKHQLGISYSSPLSHVKVASHQKLDCHRVAIQSGYGGIKVEHYCATPRLHKQAKPKDPEAERRKAEKARAALFAEATGLRRAWIREQWEARGAKLLTKDELHDALLDLAFTGVDYRVEAHWIIAAKIIGFESRGAYYDNDLPGQLLTLIEDQVATPPRSREDYAVLLWLAEHEVNLDTTDRCPELSQRDVAHFAWLERAGYAPTEIEGELINASPHSAQTTVEDQVAEATGEPAKPARKSRKAKNVHPVDGRAATVADLEEWGKDERFLTADLVPGETMCLPCIVAETDPEPGAPLEVGSLVIEAAEANEPEPPAGLVIAVDGPDIRVAWQSSAPDATGPVICDYQAGELLPAPSNAKRPDVIVEDAPDA